MIRIGKPYIRETEELAYLCADVSISEETALKFRDVTFSLKNTSWLTQSDYPPASWDDGSCTLWFSVRPQFSKYLCYERSNAFIMTFFWYAMVTGSDISFEAPVSRRLYDRLTEKLMPALAESGFEPVRLSGPVTDEPVECAEGVATGMSAGVDSFYTLHCFRSSLTHLTHFKGNHLLPYVDPPYNITEIYEARERDNAKALTDAGKVAEHNGLPLIVVDTNQSKDFYRGGLVFTAMYSFVSCSLALEHLFSTYISSSSGHKEHDLKVTLFGQTQLYEDLLTECIQTETFRYVNSDHETRYDKLRVIADDEDSQKYLDVCFNLESKGNNCGECFGCWKTMIPLDFMGKLDKFSARFDLDKYYNGRRKVFSDLINYSLRSEALAARDAVNQLLNSPEIETSESGREFLEVYKEKMLKTRDGSLPHGIS